MTERDICCRTNVSCGKPASCLWQQRPASFVIVRFCEQLKVAELFASPVRSVVAVLSRRCSRSGSRCNEADRKVYIVQLAVTGVKGDTCAAVQSMAVHSALLKGRKEMDDISHEETVSAFCNI